jgi:hypothetical protein
MQTDAMGCEASIPPRVEGAPTGSRFLEQTATLSATAREQAIGDELVAGNVPTFYRAFKPLTLSEGERSVTIYVAPDYLPLGSDDDFVRIPISPLTAQRVADTFGCSLPTRRIVDRVYASAEIKLAPMPLPPTSQMASNGYYVRHHRLIEAALPEGAHGRLIAGHKKDVVLTNALLRHPDRVAIYGWHQQNGVPIQGLNATSHENMYADYSHGIRLVLSNATVDGKSCELASLFGSDELSGLLSDEGPLRVTRTPGV